MVKQRRHMNSRDSSLSLAWEASRGVVRIWAWWSNPYSALQAAERMGCTVVVRQDPSAFDGRRISDAQQSLFAPRQNKPLPPTRIRQHRCSHRRPLQKELPAGFASQHRVLAATDLLRISRNFVVDIVIKFVESVKKWRDKQKIPLVKSTR